MKTERERRRKRRWRRCRRHQLFTVSRAMPEDRSAWMVFHARYAIAPVLPESRRQKKNLKKPDLILPFSIFLLFYRKTCSIRLLRQIKEIEREDKFTFRFRILNDTCRTSAFRNAFHFYR